MATRLKFVAVGDGGVGKTYLMKTYVNGSYPEEYVPTVFDQYSKSLMMDERLVELGLWDTSGLHDYKRLRPQSYPGTDVFLVCFSIDNPASYENVKQVWHNEAVHHCPTTPIVLVGTKQDLRQAESSSDSKSIVSTSQGQALKKLIGAKVYIECSARTMFQVNDVFNEAVRVALNLPSKDRSRCTVM